MKEQAHVFSLSNLLWNKVKSAYPVFESPSSEDTLSVKEVEEIIQYVAKVGYCVGAIQTKQNKKPQQSVMQLLRETDGVCSMHGQEYTKYKGLLYVAHQFTELKRMQTKLVDFDKSTRTAISETTVEGSRGTYTDIGDADPDNVAPRVRGAEIRMSSTRAQSRTLRCYLGIGLTGYEELPEHSK